MCYNDTLGTQSFVSEFCQATKFFEIIRLYSLERVGGYIFEHVLYTFSTNLDLEICILVLPPEPPSWRAEPSFLTSEPSRAELLHFRKRAKTSL